ncbi:MAG TPA: alpha/beta fold hydrolase [Vicinamibacterales bacterium]|nr:alpha/beta fold hydrolase [Vicinamibacterales bacterium]
MGFVAAQGQRQNAGAPIAIQTQGSFAVGGKVLGQPDAESLHCDHGYVDYQIPVNRRRINLVMWHSAAATAWLNRWDGGEGYQSIFLRRGFPVYIWDGPHVGRANWGCTPNSYEPGIGRDQQNFVAWRFGMKYPNWFDGVQFPTNDPEAWNQASRARYLEFDTIDNAQLQSDAAAKLMDRIGPSVALTNSAGGMRALLTALKTANLAGIVMYENVGYLYPEGEGPRVAESGFGPIEVPLEEFKKLTKIPLQVVWGDNVDKSDNYTQRLQHSRLFVAAINKYGGKAHVLMLPEAGLKGNTHIPFADMNNVAVADLLSKFLGENGLDKR